MTSQLADIIEQTFDYVVIGGGTAGLTVAARLVEDPTISVVVLEAGEPNLNDPMILNLGQYTAAWGNPKYDWHFMTVPQKFANDRVCQWSSGKGLGGSSALNFCAWSKPHAADVDAWEKLGNPGWNWELFQKHVSMVEHFTDATEDQLAEYPHVKYNSAYRGSAGPVKTTIPWTYVQVDRLFMDTLENMGVPNAQEPHGGNISGKWLFSNILDRESKWTRSYAATAYYLPNKDKPNYKVLTSAFVKRILFSDQKDGENVVATGIEFIYEGKTFVVRARKDVILSAGTHMSSAVLERSGVGRRDILDKIGVPIQVDLPGVGENVQDHVYAAVSYELRPGAGFTSFDMLKDARFAKEQARLQKSDQRNMHRMGITAVCYNSLQSLFPEYADTYYEGVSSIVANAKENDVLPPGREEQYNLQLQTLRDEAIPDLQILALPGFLTYLASLPDPEKIYVSMLVIQQHPFSRGSIHVTSSDPLQLPTIDPHTFENPYDLELFVKGLHYVRRMAETEPFKSGIVREVDPGLSEVSDEQLKDYIRNTASTVHHSIGTLSMLPREKNGCVDTELKVYGTANVRVADLSVIPLHISAHTQSIAYTVGHILADILKCGHLA